MTRRLTISIAAIAILSLSIPAASRSHTFPEVVPLPDGIQPEGIASGSGTEFFAGSLATGAIYKGDLRTGTGSFLNDPETDFDSTRAALGMKHDPRADALWVAGGATGQGYVYDADTGGTLAVLDLAQSQETFVNDVVVTRDSAFFTDSFQPVMYEVPLNQSGLPAGPVETHTLSGDFVFVPDNFNGNGIDATPDGDTLLLVNSATASVFTVDPDTAVATEIDVGGSSVPNGDGILLDGKTLYVVQNFLNQIGVIELSPDLTSGALSEPITSPDFMIPTTVAEFGHYLYAVNARFDTTPGPDVSYDVVQVEKD